MIAGLMRAASAVASIDGSLCHGGRPTTYLQQLDCGAPDSAASVAQDDPSADRLVEHTPVAGSTRSTRLAAAMSPAIHAVIERTCSYPVARRKVGARP